MNGIFLFLLLREIRDKLVHLHIDEIRSMDRLVQIICGERALFVSLYPQAPAIFFSKKIKDNFEKLISYTREIQSCRIERVEQSNFMPVLKLGLKRSELKRKKEIEIIISLYREAPNFSIDTGVIQKNLLPRYIMKKPKKSILELTETQIASYQNKKAGEFKKRLVTEIEGIDKYLAAELTVNTLKKLRLVLLGGKFKPRLISFTPLQISLFAGEYKKEYSSLNELLKEGIKEFNEDRAKNIVIFKKRKMITNLKRRIERLKKKLVSEKEIESYRIAGELILSNINKMTKGISQMKLFNPYTNKNIEIKLDPKETPQINAQIYFFKYKKMKRGKPQIETKIKELEQKIMNTKSDLVEPKDFAVAKLGTKKEKPLPFRIFKLSTGSLIYVGKNARSNEELTFKSAKPNDYFFHIRGYEGSHIILKAKVPKGQRPRKEDIEIAASIAAYFSKAKKQKNVAISYTQRKYLKKSKKAKPGTVILMREKVIFVNPGLPAESPAGDKHLRDK